MSADNPDTSASSPPTLRSTGFSRFMKKTKSSSGDSQLSSSHTSIYTRSTAALALAPSASSLLDVTEAQVQRPESDTPTSLFSDPLADISAQKQTAQNKIGSFNWADRLHSIDQILEIGKSVGEVVGIASAPLGAACGVLQVFVKTAQVGFPNFRCQSTRGVHFSSGSTAERRGEGGVGE